MFKNNIIQLPSVARNNLEYKIIKVISNDVDGGNGIYPAICLVEKETGILVAHTKLEFYLIGKYTNGNRLATMEAAAKVVTRFMNFILHEEKINGIQEVDRKVLGRFEKKIKKKENCPEEEVSYNTWQRYLDHLYAFLESYYDRNNGVVEFHYDPNSFKRVHTYIDHKTNKPITKSVKNVITSPPAEKPRKCRYLPESYLEFFLMEIKMHDPTLYLEVCLQAYTGCREGGIVNLSRDRIHIPAGAGEMFIDIKSRSDFAKEHMGKTPVGAIKNYRKPKVYPKFKREVKAAYHEHLKREELKFQKLGKKIDPKGPLFTNNYGNPLTTSAYNRRCKKVFMEHFVPDLEAYCLATGQYDTNKALIDAYKSAFPGCHMLRHWFTMYLKIHENLDDVQVANWRGDDSLKSYFDYMHVNQEILENFDKVTFRFQAEILMAIKEEKGNSIQREDVNDNN